MQGTYRNIEIVGVAAAVPEKVANNEIYETVLGERRVRKQAKLTGIKQTHVSPVEQRTSDLCYEAARKLLEHLQWNPEDIDVLIFASQTPNYKLPSTAFFLQKRLAIGEDCLVYDINMGCSSFNVGAQAVASHLANMKSGAKGLLLAGDICAEINLASALEPEELKNQMLFGSAGSATAFQNTAGSTFKYLLKSKGDKYDSIIRFDDRPTEMKGNAVFDFAINEVSDDIIKFQKEFLSLDETVDFYVLHQAQKLIVDSIVDTCALQEDKVLNSYSEFGNTSGASIPLSLCVNRERFSDKKQVRVLMSGFGVGLSWTILYAGIHTENILPVIFSDSHFDEDKRARRDLWNKTVLFLGTDDEVCFSALETINSYSIDHAVAVGKNGDKLSRFKQETIYKNTAIVSDKISDVIEYLEENHCPIDGVVAALTQFTPEDVIMLLNELNERKLFQTSYPGVILLEGDWGDTAGKEQMLNHIFSSLASRAISVNMIMYHADSIKYVKKLNRDSEWFLDYINSDFDSAFIKPMDIANLISKLLSEEIHYVNCTVLKIDDEIDKGEYRL